jgi:hypothetical protein
VETRVPDRLRIEHVLMLVMKYPLLRMEWRLNKRRVKGWWKRVKDHLPVQRPRVFIFGY